MIGVRNCLMMLGVLWVTTACETDIEVIAPDKDMTIIYGVLEAKNSRHYVRINRSFVGEESAADLAKINGVNEYTEEELSAYIEEYDANGNFATGKRWTLEPITIYNKEEGDFNNDSNKVYYFDANLDAELQYKIVCDINLDGEQKQVWAITDLLGNKAADGSIEEVTLNKPRLKGSNSSNQGSDRTNDEVVFVNNADFASGFEVTWANVSGGHMYTAYIRLYYRDYDLNTGDVYKDSVTLGIGTKNFEGAQGSISFNNINTQEFFSTLALQVDDLDTTTNTNIRRIVSDTLQFFLEVANEELSTYIEISQPTSNVVQERPTYTNVNNGIGIFASRLVTSTRRADKTISGRIMDNRTLEELLYSNLPRTTDENGNPSPPMYTASKSFTRPGRCIVHPSTGPRCQ